MPAPSADSQPSFLDRQHWGLSNWLLIAMAVIFVLAFVPRGVRKAIESNVNKAEDWLPASYPESTDLRWFARHYIGAKFVLCSWDGCTLGDKATIDRVAAKLIAARDVDGKPIFNRILTGPEQVASLTESPSYLTRSSAIERLEGALVGPPQLDYRELAAEDSPDAPTLAEARAMADASRTTCLIAYMSPQVMESNMRMRTAIEQVTQIVQTEVGVPLDKIHLGGPPVDNVTIDIEGEKTLLRLAGLSGIVGLALAYWCFRSLRLTWFVFSVSGISAGVSLAIVYWYGVFEINALGYLEKHLGTCDAILMSMPAVVYVLGLSGAIHIVNYYREERDAHGTHGAAERGVRVGWWPCLLAALTTAVGLGSLGASHIIPIKKFGIFCASGVLATVAVLLCILPICLHLFPPKLPGDEGKKDQQPRRRKPADQTPLPGWAQALARFVTRRYGVVATLCLAAMATFAIGLGKTDTKVRLLGLLDPQTRLIQDYRWFEKNLGNLVPMEVVVALSDKHTRTRLEPSDAGDHYRMTMVERMRLVDRIKNRVETLEPVSRTMSAATFGPAERPSASASQRRATEFTTSKALDENRDALAEYLVREIPKRDAQPADDARELWRISARVAALSDIDYGHFVGDLQRQVEPVLDVYLLRDKLLARLREQGKGLVGSRVAVVFDAARELRLPAEDSIDAILVDLLQESGVSWTIGAGAEKRVGKLGVYNAAILRSAKTHESGDKTEAYRKKLASFDAVVTISDIAAAAVKPYVGEGVTHVTLEGHGVETAYARSQTNASLAADASLAAVYTGIVPLVYKTQRELLTSLQESIGWATVLIACVMVLVLRSPGGGLVSMIPNVFPIVTVFGTLGWLGINIDIGIMMTASVALGVAVDDTIHFLTWFRRGIVQGLDRRSATLLAFDRCAIAMTQTTLIAGLGLAVFATSTFTPTQQFGSLMITMLGAALVGDLIMLPALLCGPLGRFFAPGAPAAPPEDEAVILPMPSVEAVSQSPAADTSLAAGETRADASTTDGPIANEPNVDQSSVHEPAIQQQVEPPPQPPVPEPPVPEPSVPEPLSPANAALKSKLEKFRRS